MTSNSIFWLGLLSLVLAVIAVRLVQAASEADALDPFLSAPDDEFEHECNAHWYPNVGD
jgi:hypothetical protein